VDSIWDVDDLPPATKEVMANHLWRFFAYAPKSYSGGIMLFRARPLPHSLDRDWGWGRVAGGVEVIVREGSHYNLLRASRTCGSLRNELVSS
jgi:hypothetical protein